MFDELVASMDFGGAHRRMVYLKVQVPLVSQRAESPVILRNRQYYIYTCGLRLPSAGVAGHAFLTVAACSVALSFTVAAQFLLRLAGANGSSQEEPMGLKVYRKVVRTSVLEVVTGIGTAAIGGCLAA